MKNAMCVSALALCFALTLHLNLAAADLSILLRQGLDELRLARGDSALCVITDAPFVRFEGRVTPKALGLIEDETGCSAGGGNLLAFLRPQTHPLVIALFNRNTKQARVVHQDSAGAKLVALNFDPLSGGSGPEWETAAQALGRDSGGLMLLANAWAAGAPYDFLKCAELHNHICGGLTSGYCLVRYIQQRYPLSRGGQYKFIACPQWCKDDALQLLLDISPGKKSMFAKDLSQEQLDGLRRKDVAGILILTRDRGPKDPAVGGKAVVLCFDWDRVTALTGPSPTGMAQRIQSLLKFLSFADRPEEFVSSAAEYELDAGKLARLTEAGVNPYLELGFTK